MPQSYVVIYERQGPEVILYVSSNCRQALGYAPEEMVGTSILEYSADEHARHYSCSWPADNPEIGVTLMPHNLRHKDGRTIFSHVICINCTGHIFTIVTTYEEFGFVNIGESVLYKLQHESNFDTAANGGSVFSIGGGDVGKEMVDLSYPRITMDTLRKAHIHTARACRDKACFVLSRPDRPPGDSTLGPTVVFVTNSISRIFDGHMDGYEVINMPFFSIVAPADITKAAVFMDALTSTPRPHVCALNLLRRPIHDESGGRDVIQVELIGAISDDGAVLLCQKVQKKDGADRDEPGYMSLEEIISSDPDSSDFPDQWSSFTF
ncbi:hypothetical protein GQ54DRAFT_297409 [Martensiomyces pterosporus]|nr:hypothetical protein GQ54DRAFT_297409 [Martensiomyces pterosporus]